MQNEQRGQFAWEAHKKISENEKARRILLIENARLINEVHSKKYYKDILGDENASWSAYLSLFETFYTASKVYMLDKIYLKFIKELGLHPEQIAHIPHSKLSNLIGVVNKENVAEWLTKVEELTSQDFNDELRKATGKISYLECDHHNSKDYSICASCGFRHAK